VGLIAFGCAGIVPVHPAKAMLRTTSDVSEGYYGDCFCLHG
jgi:hypothetical protein